MNRWMSALLALCLVFGMVSPVAVFATEAGAETTRGTGGVLIPEIEFGTIPEKTGASDEEELVVEDYATFLENLKVLEGYAASFAATSGKDAGELVLNFIRTGVERYNESLWPQLAGQEITAFTEYVNQQDAANGTTAMILRNIELFDLPNGNEVDFGHMFGTMNISYINVQKSADLGGWAGDICDLLNYSYYYGNVPAGTIDEMAAYIKVNCFGVNADDAFGMDDFYGDMDAIYLIDQMKAGTKLSAAMEAYFTEELDDADRSAYFLNHRFSGLETHEDVRNAVYDAYISNIGLNVLETDRGIEEQDDLRMACCYAFADYVFEQGGDRLEGGSGEEPEDPENPPVDPEDPDVPENPDEPEDPEEPEEPVKDTLHDIFSSSTSVLAPGVTQQINYALSQDGKQMVYYIATIDVNRDDLTIYANYRGNDPSGGWGMQRVTDQIAAAVNRHTDPNNPETYIENYTPVVGVNGDFYNMSNGKPSGALVMEGVQYSGVGNENFFAILDDGTAVIGTPSEWDLYADRVVEAIGGSVMLVRDGVNVIGDGSDYYNNRAPRTCAGITADGQVVLLVIDGRQEPFSAGGSAWEIAELMIEAGCVNAMNLDGGGSSTFAAKPEGSDTIRVINSPSDGYERSVSSSLVVVSTAVVSNEFDRAAISCEYDYLTIGTELPLTAVGVSSSGNAADIPENAVWQISDDSIGSITQDGVFTASDYGTVEVQLTVEGAVVGKKTLNVVMPDAVSFAEETMSAIYGVETELVVTCSYKGNPVAYNMDDIWVYPEDDYAAYVDGTTFVGYENYGMRHIRVYVELYEDWEIYDEIIINMFKSDEAVFDFDNATAGDRTLAWDRVITNSTTNDGFLYQVTDPSQNMDISYTFALDMTEIDIPEKLQGIVYMLPGGDQVDATAWDFLMQLAERVSVLSEVKVTAQFDMNLDVDVSELKVANDYFYMKNAELDEATNTLTLICGWVDQTQAVDPDTANPICILSGIKAVPKADAAWDAEEQLNISITGEVTYNIFLRANALYSFALKEENQEKYGLIPFENPDVIINGATEKGASFGDTYTDFSDNFVLDKSNRQGWMSYENHLYYYVDNVAIGEGIHLLPGYEDPANMYYYSFAEDGSCSGTVTGLFELEDGLHYAILGAPRVGWQTVLTESGETQYYFFDRKTGVAADGVQKIDGYTYTFTDHVLTRGEIVKDSKGYRYRWAGAWVTSGWTTIDGEIYYCQQNEYFEIGRTKRYGPDGTVWYVMFDEYGRWIREYSGFYDDLGKTYLVENGFVIPWPGVVEKDGDYYYFNSQDYLVKNTTTWISKGNGILEEKTYTIDADGKILLDEGDKPGQNPDDPGTELKNGIVEEDGELYYYVDGVRTYAGLIIIDGDYYYVNSSYKVVRNCTYWISKTNGLLPEGSYTFDENGKLVFEGDKPDVPNPPAEPEEPKEPEVPEIKNGIVAENGDLYYYVDGVLTYAGVIVIDGDYYYVNSACRVIHSCTYWISKTNGLLPEKNYTFDETGKIVFASEKPNPPAEPENPEVKNGIVEENGDLYYYVNGVRTYAGVVVIDGDYYYVNSSYKVVRGCTYWITKTNGLLPEQCYRFDDTGKIIFDGGKPTPPTEPENPEDKNGIVEENGDLYYYVNGVRTYAGVIVIDGDYYYVNSTGRVIHSCRYWISKTNGLLPEGAYTFDDQGRMVLD